ncbi:hemerythrin domain-containing protein [Ramlibacter sp. USB13]|uniref:Hemerythrin domain-containing protein n=1 Tax=Ramlibacter cellulosilyticus TaxID=2764187 RepID=A0A923SBL8_9BURK|nr:hemerythrin domain-containing protein [Ramlibacter cellulosilyticus]MBC5784031.1 hemerythrin domain-containing protein [Ramlibacter cellulosilyticus]
MKTQAATPVLAGAPLRQFRGAHSGILSGLAGLEQLPALATAAERARETAAATLDLFDRVVRGHHGDEEETLFDAVQRSCRGAEERQQVEDFVVLLTAQHRQIEALWDKLRPAVVRIAAGKPANELLFGAEVDRLVSLYEEHAHREEEGFLPLADAILRRDGNHMAALDIALHLRHAPLPRAYI